VGTVPLTRPELRPNLCGSPMRRVLALALPDLAIDLARRRRRRAERPAPGSAAPLDVGAAHAERPLVDARRASDAKQSGPAGRGGRRPARAAAWPHPGSPILLTEAIAGRALVVRRCPSAAARGVRVGLTVDEARALLAPAQPWIEEHRPDRDARALAALGQWALRFSPFVALDHGGTLDSGSAPHTDGGLVMDVAGLERLAGDEGRHARRILESVSRLGFRARVAVADTLGAAWALARFGPRSPLVIESGDEERALAPLPLEALRLAPAVVDGLRELSVARVEDLARIDRARLAARFGGDVLLRLDQALGRAFEPITPLRPEEPPEVERIFEGPVRQWEAVQLTLEELVHELCTTLGHAGLGATELALELATSDRPPGAPPERCVLSLGRASANPRHIWNVARPRAEHMHMGFGVERVRIVARHTARLPLEQASAFERGAVEHGLAQKSVVRRRDRALEQAVARTQGHVERALEPKLEHLLDRALGELVDVLVGRLGGDAVCVLRAIETHVPERVYRARPLLQADDSPTRGLGNTARLCPAPRPSLLFTQPERAECTPHERSLAPGAGLIWRTLHLELDDVLGPERIARPWWETRADDAPEVHRDYYRVRTRCGRRLWLFTRGGALFVHGEWA
jgi:protein ImuB